MNTMTVVKKTLSTLLVFDVVDKGGFDYSFRVSCNHTSSNRVIDICIKMAVVLKQKDVHYLFKSIGLLHYKTCDVAVDDTDNPFVPDDLPMNEAFEATDDEDAMDLLAARVANFKEKDTNKDDYYTVINRISTQVIGSIENCRAGYVFLLVRRSDNVPCMSYYARDKENVANNFDHSWLKWQPEFANWIIYDNIHNKIGGKVIGSLLDD